MRRHSVHFFWLGATVLAMAASGCELLVEFDRGKITADTDSGPVQTDTGPIEVDGALDAGEIDSGFDAGADTGVMDTGVTDTGPVDAPVTDTGVDSGTDAGIDSGPLDSGTDAGPECEDDDDCDDGNPCTTDACNGNECELTFIGDGEDCDDGLFCTVNDECDSSTTQCVGTARNCNLTCTSAESCDEAANTCVRTIDTGCLIGETCISTGTEMPGNDCMVCDPTQSQTAYVAHSVGTTCDDGLYCNSGETCDGAGSCEGGAARACGDSNSCTVDACDETANACIHTAVNDVMSAVGFAVVATADAVVLRNPSATRSLDIGSYYLCFSDLGDPIESCFNIPASTSLPADGFIEIREGTGTNTATVLYAGDAFELDTAEGELAITTAAFPPSDSTQICDYVQWGMVLHTMTTNAVLASEWSTGTAVSVTGLDAGEALLWSTAGVGGADNNDPTDWSVGAYTSP